MGKIDFVIPWVDGSDEAWLKEKNSYLPDQEDFGSASLRFRSWDNLQYFFRGVEKFTPWVNKIFFVTWGHIPAWLDTENPKIQVVKHSDFIPQEYLPTFNSSTIMLNLHRIEGLSENFVLFNDDTFLLKEASEEAFFKNDLPVDEFGLNPIMPIGNRFMFAHTVLNNTAIINRYFDKKTAFKKYWRKYLHPKYKSTNIRTLLLLPWGCFVGFHNHHLTISHKKSTFETLWEKEKELLDETCRHRFRERGDLNDWLMRYWNLCAGEFVPRSHDFGHFFETGKDNDKLVSYIRRQKGTIICLNDTAEELDFEKTVKEINSAFESILPEKSSFEK